MVRTGRRPGPSTTRADIVAAAAARFAAAGYDATSLRQVAADAGVDPALVRRFFVDKEGLFTAVKTALIDPPSAMAAVRGGSPDEAGERLLRYFLGLLGDVERPGPLLGLIRCAVTSEHAAVLMRRFLGERMVAQIAGTLRMDQPQLRAALVASQLAGIAVARYAVQLEPLTSTGTEELVRWYAPVLQHYLTGNPSVAGHPCTGQEERADTRGTGE